MSIRLTGKASTYGNDPKIGWVDHGDNNRPALGGASNNNPGIAVYNQKTLGGYWRVKTPHGRSFVIQQTDIGPSPGTARVVDINATASRKLFGINAGAFPTDQGTWNLKYLGKGKGAASMAGKLPMSGAAKPKTTTTPAKTVTIPGIPLANQTDPKKAYVAGMLANLPQFKNSALGGLFANLAGGQDVSATAQANAQPLNLTIPGKTTTTPAPAAAAKHSTSSGPLGKVTFAPGADRPGVPTSDIVRRLLAHVAGAAGTGIQVGTGSAHDQMTTSGNVSDHWTGHAADIPVPIDSQRGDLIAGRALMYLGISRTQARHMAQQGGLYNVTPTKGPFKGHRVQVIWKTYEGGDHHNHVHIGIR